MDATQAMHAVVTVAYESLAPEIRNAVALHLMLYGRSFAGHPLETAIKHLLEPTGQMHEFTAEAFLAAHDRALKGTAL